MFRHRFLILLLPLVLFSLIFSLYLLFRLKTPVKKIEKQKSPAPEIMVTDSNVFPIFAWNGPPPDAPKYQEYKDAGFNTLFVVPSPDALTLASSLGLNAIIYYPDVFNGSNPEGIANLYKNYPAMVGYYLADEPMQNDFPRLADIVNRLKAVDPKHYSYINLLPIGATSGISYDQYLNAYTTIVPTDYISYDLYPITSDTNGTLHVNSEFYHNLEIVSAKAKASGRTFWTHILSSPHYSYPIPTLSQLRFQAFSALAYGSQMLQYFTYNTGNDRYFNSAPIDENGNKTPIYYLVKQVNSEIQALAPIFKGCTVNKVGHIGTIPNGTTSYTPSPPVESITASGLGVLVSSLTKNNINYIAIVNHDIERETQVNIKFQDLFKVSFITKQFTFQTVLSGLQTYNIEPGDMIVFVTSLPQPTSTPIPTPKSPFGTHDTTDCTASSGWSCDGDNFSQPVTIHFYDGPVGNGGTFLGSTTANIGSVGDLSGWCGGYSNHWFYFLTPDSVKNGQPHNIYAYGINLGVSGYNSLLWGSPKTITCQHTLTPSSTPASNPTISPSSLTPTVTPTITITPTITPTLTPSITPTPVASGSPTPTTNPSTIYLRFGVKLFGVSQTPDIKVRLIVVDPEVLISTDIGCLGSVNGKYIYSDITLTADSLGVYHPKQNTQFIGSISSQLTTTADGFLPLSGLTPDKRYSIFVKGPIHRSMKMLSYTALSGGGPFSYQNYDWSSNLLEPGDLPDPNHNSQQNCVINSIDLGLITDRIGHTDQGALSIADVNYDGIVNGNDVAKVMYVLSSRPDDD